MSGIQRAGSTLITKLMNQHPDVFASNTSSLFDFLFVANEKLAELEKTSSSPQYINRKKMLYDACQSYYSFTDKTNIIDKHRGWAANWANVNRDMLPNPKVIVTLRPFEETAASFYKILKKNGHIFTMEQIWKDFLDEPYKTLQQSAEFKQHLHIVQYKDLIADTQGTMNKILDYLEITNYNFDLNNIVDNDPENDKVWGIDGLHTVRKSVSYESIPPEQVMNNDELMFFRKATKRVYEAFELEI